jgi:hypothetical protein
MNRSGNAWSTAGSLQESVSAQVEEAVSGMEEIVPQIRLEAPLDGALSTIYFSLL